MISGIISVEADYTYRDLDYSGYHINRTQLLFYYTLFYGKCTNTIVWNASWFKFRSIFFKVKPRIEFSIATFFTFSYTIGFSRFGFWIGFSRFSNFKFISNKPRVWKCSGSIFMTSVAVFSYADLPAGQWPLFIFSTDAKKAVIITSASWLLVTIVLHAFLNAIVRSILQTISVFLFILLPAVNHIRMFLAIRRHNSQIVGQVGAQQLSVIFRREVKVAADMVIVVAVLVACLGPIFVTNMALQRFLEIRARLYPWAFTMMYLNSSINPLLYLTRNRELRRALGSVLRSCCSCF